MYTYKDQIYYVKNIVYSRFVVRTNEFDQGFHEFAFFKSPNFSVIPVRMFSRPPYSPDLTQCIFFFFQKSK